MSKRVLELGKLTDAERLWFYRRSLGLTQYEMATRLEVGHNIYCNMELGRREVPKKFLRGSRVNLARTDLLPLARRRMGWGLARTAAKLGVSRITLLAYERTADGRLVKFWGAFGFTGF